MSKYPDITSLLKSKATQRRDKAALPFEEKIKIVMRLQKLSNEIKKANKAREIKGKIQSGMNQD